MKIYEKSLNEMKKIVARYTEQTIDFEIEKTVSEIIQNVAQNGDQAVRDYERKFDSVNLADFSIPAFQLDQALDSIDEDLRAALELAKQNITSFHKQEIENSFVDVSTPGIMRGEKITPLASVGLYVPGGTAAYPSTILMCGIPAKLAGVKRVVMVTPPQPAGINPAVLAAARLAGVDEVYQVGGAQAIAALAYGTETIPAVDKIMGPGNIFVATAKKQVFGKVAIDMVAGPSEIGILADESANAKEIAADLLSQAEHDKRARAMLITNSKSLAEAVSKEIERQLSTLPRQAIARTSIEDRGFIAVMENTAEMFELMNDVAPEHLEVQLKNPTQYLGLIKNAGSVFLGRYASEPLGDYVAGPNHVLPTGGTARFASPLGVYDFVKRTQFIQFDRQNLKADLKAITKLARLTPALLKPDLTRRTDQMRKATINRATKETQIKVALNLDDQSQVAINTGVGFFDHMLELFAKHGRFGLVVEVKGDLNVDAHHTVEDTGIVLGQCFKEALGDKAQIERYGNAFVPMDETLAQVTVDLSGRSYLVFDAELTNPRLGAYETEITEDFFQALAFNAEMNLHARVLYGRNTHHKIEGLFKATARAMRQAVTINPAIQGINSTKGMI